VQQLLSETLIPNGILDKIGVSYWNVLLILGSPRDETSKYGRILCRFLQKRLMYYSGVSLVDQRATLTQLRV
jgi:hypothetical protein